MKHRHFYFLFACAILTIGFARTSGQVSETDWLTWWEKSGYLETPRYDATIDYCKRLAKASHEVHYTTFGVSPRGRDLPLLIFDKHGCFTPEKADSAGKLKLLIQACIHAGETDGKDAGLLLFRDYAISGKEDLNLDSITILFIPIFNVDGHERFTPFSRINQNGPKEAGWRTTASNLNLNRDYLKADAPEMQEWLKLYSQWNPDFFIDTHTTDGADYQYVITTEFDGLIDKTLMNWLSETYFSELISRLNESGFPAHNYVWFRNWHDPKSGLVDHMPEPRFSIGYTSSCNRPSLLIETHMLKSYQTRVEGTLSVFKHTINILGEQKHQLQNLIGNADDYTASEQFREIPCVLEYLPSMKDSVMIPFKGVEYTEEISDLTGGHWYRYTNNPKEFVLPLFNKQEASVQVDLPEAYVIPAEWTEVINRLRIHGIKYDVLKNETVIDAKSYQFSDVKWEVTPFEGRQIISQIKTEEITLEKKYPPGSVIVPLNQPKARLIAFMFEPASKESLLRWGFFNTIFEQKEYFETYVMEEMAREMIQKNPEMKDDFEKWKSSNPGIAADSRTQLDWFYRKTPYFDSSLNIYPVCRIFTKEQLESVLDKNKL
ncbi:MAG TPA: M14 family metallopeptidase [Bacteroidales bacterium]|nr:M14 family metallopeptidase [Bacteroidales bacterium]